MKNDRDTQHEVSLGRGSGHVMTYDGIAREFKTGELVLRCDNEGTCARIAEACRHGKIVGLLIGELDLVNYENLIKTTQLRHE